MKGKRNVIARDLRTPKYRKRIVVSKRVYTRSQKHRKGYGSDGASSFSMPLILPAVLCGGPCVFGLSFESIQNQLVLG